VDSGWQRKHKFSRICQVVPMCLCGRVRSRHLPNMTEPSVWGSGDVVSPNYFDHLFVFPPIFAGRMPFLPPNQQCQSTGGWWRWALVSPDGVPPSRMVGVSASVNLPVHRKVQKFSSGTVSPGWSRKRAVKRLWWLFVLLQIRLL